MFPNPGRTAEDTIRCGRRSPVRRCSGFRRPPCCPEALIAGFENVHAWLADTPTELNNRMRRIPAVCSVSGAALAQDLRPIAFTPGTEPGLSSGCAVSLCSAFAMVTTPEPNDIDLWLRGSYDEIRSLQRPFEAVRMAVRGPVSLHENPRPRCQIRRASDSSSAWPSRDQVAERESARITGSVTT